MRRARSISAEGGASSLTDDYCVFLLESVYCSLQVWGFFVFCTNSVLLSSTSTVPASKAHPYENIPQSHAHGSKMQFQVVVFQTVLEQWLGAVSSIAAVSA